MSSLPNSLPDTCWYENGVIMFKWVCPNCLSQDDWDYHNKYGVTLVSWRSIISHIRIALGQDNYDELEDWLLVAEKKANYEHD